jgi:hypothetical protein
MSRRLTPRSKLNKLSTAQPKPVKKNASVAPIVKSATIMEYTTEIFMVGGTFF